jgi:hypothetical protein
MLTFVWHRYSDPEVTARKLIEIANSVEAVQDGRIYIALINGPMLFEHKATPAEYKAGLDLAVTRGPVRHLREVHPGGRGSVRVTTRAAAGTAAGSMRTIRIGHGKVRTRAPAGCRRALPGLCSAPAEGAAPRLTPAGGGGQNGASSQRSEEMTHSNQGIASKSGLPVRFLLCRPPRHNGPQDLGLSARPRWGRCFGRCRPLAGVDPFGMLPISSLAGPHGRASSPDFDRPSGRFSFGFYWPV